MMQAHIGDLPRFFRVVNGCCRPVRVLTEGGGEADLRQNAFLQALLLQSHTGITKLTVQPQCSADAMRIVGFMLDDGAPRANEANRAG